MKDSLADAKSYALKLLGYRARSRKELSDRLRKKGCSGRQTDEVIEQLQSAGLINDEDLAPQLLRYSIEYKSFGKKGIRTFLAKRGLGRALIDKTLSNHTLEVEEKTAVEFVERKMRTLSNYSEDIARQKLWGMLLRRGFSGDVIKRVIDAVKI